MTTLREKREASLGEHTVGQLADMYADVRALRLAMEKEVEPFKKRESEIKNEIIDRLSKSEDTGAAGLKYRAQIVMKVLPKLADWQAFTSFVQETGRFDLMQKRISDKAVMDMLENQEEVPGVERINIPDVSITKI